MDFVFFRYHPKIHFYAFNCYKNKKNFVPFQILLKTGEEKFGDRELRMIGESFWYEK